MEKKRSVGVTILAILLILGGVVSLISGLFFISGKSVMRPQFTVSQYKDFMLKTTPNMSAQDMEKFEKEVTPFLGKIVQAQNEIVKSNIVNICLPLNGILGLIGLVSGIGLFQLKEFARKGIIVFMLLSIPITLTINFIGMREMIKITAKFIPEITHGPVNMLSIVPAIVVIQGIFLIVVVLFIAYYLTRPKVKEQFK